MSSINPAKKRKAARDPPRERGNDDPSTVVPANAILSLADLNKLIDQRVMDVVGARILELTSRVDGLQRENEGLLRRCESLERSVQVLKAEGNWTYSAPDVPRSHWIDQGHDEDYADEAEYLLRSIKVSTKGLRSASRSKVTVRGGSPQSPTLSDDALYPHWEQLSNAIQLSERITTLTLGDVQLDQRTLQIIEASVRQKGITKFYLAGNQFIEGEGVQFAINVLKSNRLVEKFGWGVNFFQDNEDVCELVDAVLEHPTISNVGFIGTLDEGIISYTSAKRLFVGTGTDTLLKVNLSYNSIETNGDRCIPDFLAANPPLIRLHLGENHLNDDDVLHIGLALQSNTNLRCLDLRDNSMTDNGKKYMIYHSVCGLSRSELAGLTSANDMNLNTVSEANHTCEIRVSGRKIFVNHGGKPAAWNRGRKLLWLLVNRHLAGCNISQLELEFSENSMGIVPHVLAGINTYCAGYAKAHPKGHCLSLLFELARDWKTPEMYQFNGAQPNPSETLSVS